MSNLEFDINNLINPEHEANAHKFLEDAKSILEEYPDMYRYAFDLTAENITRWEDFVKEQEEVLSGEYISDLEEEQSELYKCYKILQELDEESAHRTEIVIGLRVGLNNEAALYRKDKIKQRLNELAVLNSGYLETEDNFIDRTKRDPNSAFALHYIFERKSKER